MMNVGRLERVPIRNVWRTEDKDFTPWLADNIDLLGEVIGMELSFVSRETDVGMTFRADLLAEGPNGDVVLIENQFGKSDHDHLGKILTYMTNLEAKTTIWICETPQPDHIETVRWLNKNTPEDMSFYLIKLEVFKVGNSSPAPHFSIVAEPSTQIKEAGEVKGEYAERHKRRIEFWGQLLEKSKERTSLFSNVSPSKENWISAGAGISDVVYQYVITMDEGKVLLCLWSKDADKNKLRFDKLHQLKQQIEADFGESLSWERRDNLKSSQIVKVVTKKGLKDQDDWSTIQEKMVDSMIRLEKAIGKHIKA
jgi:hypothetical protein